MDTSDIRVILSDNETESRNESQNVPIESDTKDRFGLVYILFFMLGLSQLLPFNFLVNADDLWMYKFRDINAPTNATNKSELQIFFGSYLIIACNTPFMMVYLISLTDYFQKIDNHFKNLVTFICTIFVFALITFSTIINTDQYQSSFLIILLCLVFILNSAAITIQSNFTGIASLFPTKYMQAMIFGQAISGLFAAISKILSSIFSHSLVFSVFGFFIFADLILVTTFILYLIVRKKPFYKFYSPSLNFQTYEPMNRTLFIRIFKHIWPFCLTLMFVFWVTLSVFPSVFVRIIPSPNQSMIVPEKFIFTITIFLIFNIGDFLGRYFGKNFLLSKDKRLVLFTISLCRIVFIPLFFYCNAQPRHHPVFFDSEFYFVLFNILFSLLNGYLVLNAFINGPLSLPENYRHIAGYFLVTFLGLGLTLGSLTSLLILSLL